MPKKPERHHGERDSQFFRLRSKAKLAKLLFISEEKMQALAKAEGLYYRFQKPKLSGGHRDISAPRDDLKAVQARIADLLHRIAPPDYLFAPVSGRSYVDNAAAHLGAQSVRLLDIEDFFPSCTENKVIWFFHKRMQCSPDVAAILKGIVTENGALPQGSPCSPILAYLTYIDMWEEIFVITKGIGCTLSVYADDLTISGDTVPEAAIWYIKKALYRHGHRYKAAKERSRHFRPAEITGVILTTDGLRVPNRQRKRLIEIEDERRSVRSPDARKRLDAQIRGRRAQIAQITNAKF